MSKIPENTAHYTPPEMALRLAHAAIDPLLKAGLYPAQIHVYDPACGGGALLLAAMRVLVEATLLIGFGEHDHNGHWSGGAVPTAQDAHDSVVTGCLLGTDIDGDAAQSTANMLSEYVSDELTVSTWKMDPLIENLEAPLRSMGWGIGRHGGINCVIMNPPYLGGGKISGAMGSDYLKLLKEYYPGCGGQCDLAGYFLRLASEVCCTGSHPSTIACVATNTIAQGDTRRGGLANILCEDGWDVRWAGDSAPWPGEAKLSVRLFALSRGLPLGYESPKLWASTRLRSVPEIDRWLG